MTGLIRGLAEERDTLQGARRHRHTPDLPSREPEIPLPTLSHDAPELFKAALQVVVAEEQALDGPDVLPHGTVAQIGLYAHRVQADRASGSRPGCELLLPLPPYQRPDGMTRRHPTASVCRCTILVVRVLGLRCSKRPTLSELRGPMRGSAYGLLRIHLPRRSRIGTVSCPASKLRSLLRALLRIREARLGVPRRARTGGTPLAHPNHLKVSLGMLCRREGLP